MVQRLHESDFIEDPELVVAAFNQLADQFEALQRAIIASGNLPPITADDAGNVLTAGSDMLASWQQIIEAVQGVGNLPTNADNYEVGALWLRGAQGIYEVLPPGQVASLYLNGWTPTSWTTAAGETRVGFDLRDSSAPQGTRPTGMPSTYEAMFRVGGVYNIYVRRSQAAQSGYQITRRNAIFDIREIERNDDADPLLHFQSDPVRGGLQWRSGAALAVNTNYILHSTTLRWFTTTTKQWSRAISNIPAPAAGLEYDRAKDYIVAGSNTSIETDDDEQTITISSTGGGSGSGRMRGSGPLPATADYTVGDLWEVDRSGIYKLAAAGRVESINLAGWSPARASDGRLGFDTRSGTAFGTRPTGFDRRILAFYFTNRRYHLYATRPVIGLQGVQLNRAHRVAALAYVNEGAGNVQYFASDVQRAALIWPIRALTAADDWQVHSVGSAPFTTTATSWVRVLSQQFPAPETLYYEQMKDKFVAGDNVILTPSDTNQQITIASASHTGPQRSARSTGRTWQLLEQGVRPGSQGPRGFTGDRGQTGPRGPVTVVPTASDYLRSRHGRAGYRRRGDRC